MVIKKVENGRIESGSSVGVHLSQSIRPYSRAAYVLLAIALTGMACAYLGKGFTWFWRPENATDLRARSAELRYVWRGTNPYDVVFAALPAAHAVQPSGQASVTRNAAVDEELGVPYEVDYPPWAYLTGWLFFWPPAAFLRAYYCVVLLAGLAGIVLWAMLQTRHVQSIPAAVIVGLSVLAMSEWCGSIFTGNLPVPILAILCLSLWLAHRKQDWLAGLLLGFALMKPSLVAPFLIPFLFTRRWKILGVALGYVLAASLVIWRLSHTNPLEMLQQMVAMSRLFTHAGFGPVQYLIRAGVSPDLASKSVALAVLLLGTPLLWRLRRAPLPAQFAVASVVGRLWSYHFYYDDTMLLFMLVLLARHAFAGTRWGWPAFLIFGASVWIPGSLTVPLAIQLAMQSIWVGSAILVAFNPAFQRDPAPALSLPREPAVAA